MNADAISAPERCSPAMPTRFPISSGPFLKMPYALRPMSSAAMPGSFASPIGSVMASLPSAPRAGPMPNPMKLSQ